MKKMLTRFVKGVLSTPEARKKFAACKNLRESYEKFKDELKGCSYAEYEKFFTQLAKTKAKVSAEELGAVSGGVSLKNLLAPAALLTMFAAAPSVANMLGSDIPSVGVVAHAMGSDTAEDSEMESEEEMSSVEDSEMKPKEELMQK